MQFLSTYRGVHQARTRYLLLYGGAGSGKSFYAAQRILSRALTEPGHRFLVVRKVARTLRGSTFQLLLDIIERDPPIKRVVRARSSDMTLLLKNGSEIVHAGLDDAEKLKSIAGVTGVWIEEATEITEDDFRQVDLRLRGESPSYKQIIFTFNPIDERHWIKRRYFDEYPTDTTLFHTTYLDNPRAGEEYTQVLEGIDDERFYQVYTLGEWGQAVRGLVYPSWDAAPMPGSPDAYGLDFGYNNPTALIAVRLEGEERLHAEELLYDRRLTNTDLIARLEGLVPDRAVPIYCDSAEPQRIAEIIDAGFNAHPADKSVTDGIDHVRRMTLHVSPSSVNMHSELRSYKYAETRAGETLDKPVKYLDHALDALRYAVHTHYQYASWLAA